MGKLDGRVALVTGGSSGIGFATAQEFVGEGAYVFVTGRREKELATAVKEIGRNVTRHSSGCFQLSGSRPPVLANQKRKRKTRYRVRECRRRQVRTLGSDQ